jgi:hypothetical protein
MVLKPELTGQTDETVELLEHEKHCQTVSADFYDRNDTKIAMVYFAFKQGAIEFLRFKGESL